MARYVLSNRRAGKFRETDKRASREIFGTALHRMAADVNVVWDSQPQDQNVQDRRVVIIEANPADMAVRARDLPADVILEPEILHWPAFNIPIDFIGVQPTPATAIPAAGANSRTVTVQVLGAGNPLPHAKVLLFLRGAGGAENKLEDVANGNGVVTFTFPSFWRPAALVAIPYAGFWTMVLRGLGRLSLWIAHRFRRMVRPAGGMNSLALTEL